MRKLPELVIKMFINPGFSPRGTTTNLNKNLKFWSSNINHLCESSNVVVGVVPVFHNKRKVGVADSFYKNHGVGVAPVLKNLIW